MHSTVLVHNKQVFPFSRISFTGRSLCILIGIAISSYYYTYFFVIPFASLKAQASYEKSYCSLVTFREVFFINKVHRKPKNLVTRSWDCMIFMHRKGDCCKRSKPKNTDYQKAFCKIYRKSTTYRLPKFSF